ncbi:beta-ketoacyl synthase [Mycena vulgaris]|nr:beta-ketoacyl synthase [Mycena vulgaris]
MPQDIAIVCAYSSSSLISSSCRQVGISAEIPGGDRTPKNLGHESFFEFLLNRGQSYEKLPAYRMNIDAWKGFNLGQISTEMGSFLKDIDLFDNVEFGVSGKDARAMAASTRKLIETCFLALADSGIDYRSQNVGCFVSGTMYELATVSEPNEFDAQGSFASAPSMMANRVSYHLDLEGPSIASDTACSASCTALHLAVTSILSGDCNAAVVAGCQLNYQFSEWFNYSGGHVLAKDGKCKPFDASADGFSRGEAVVAIVVKPLSKAMADGDVIYGTVNDSQFDV